MNAARIGDRFCTSWHAICCVWPATPQSR